MKQLFLFDTEVIYAMCPMKDKKNGLLVSSFSGCWLKRRGLGEKIDKPRSQLFQMHLIPKCLAECRVRSQHRQYLNCYTQFNNPRRDMRGNKIWNQIEKSRICDSFTYFCKSLRVKYCNWESVSGLQMGKRRAH